MYVYVGIYQKNVGITVSNDCCTWSMKFYSMLCRYTSGGVPYTFVHALRHRCSNTTTTQHHNNCGGIQTQHQHSITTTVEAYNTTTTQHRNKSGGIQHNNNIASQKLWRFTYTTTKQHHNNCGGIQTVVGCMRSGDFVLANKSVRPPWKSFYFGGYEQ